MNTSLVQKFSIYCVIFLGISGPAYAIETYKEELNRLIGEMEKICATVESLTPSPQDLADLATQTELENGCDPSSLYYGFDQEPDYVKARQCGLLGQHSNVYLGDNFALAMIYANGKGVQRNLDLAMHFVCIDGSNPADKAYQIDTLQKLKLSQNIQEEFNMCARVFSREMIGNCLYIKNKLTDKKREKEFAILVSKWTLAEQQAFHKLLEASQVFFKEHSEREVDKSGRDCALIMLEEKSELDQKFFEMVKAIDQCKLPSFSSKQFEEADKILNTLYKKALSAEFDYSWGITSDGIKTTQRAWIKYRDAWVNFGHLKCSNISKESWKTIITKERIEQLNSLVN